MSTRSSGITLALLLVCAENMASTPLPPMMEPCVTLRRDAERLACFDQAAAALRSGGDSPAPSPENMFGVHGAMEAPPANGSLPQRDELRQITALVTSLRRADDGIIVIELDNGQVWRQQDAAAKLVIHTGDEVTIVRAALGTFRIADKSGRFARFKRVR